MPDSNRLKPPRWPSRLRSREAREQVWGTLPRQNASPNAAVCGHVTLRLFAVSRRTRQSGSPSGLLGGPAALIYQPLSLTPPGSAVALARLVEARSRPLPSPRRPILWGWEFRCLLPKHNLLTEGGHDPPPYLAHQYCLEDRRRREIPFDFHSKVAARPRPRRTVVQRVLRRFHARIAVVATHSHLFPDSVHYQTVFTNFSFYRESESPADVSPRRVRRPVLPPRPLAAEAVLSAGPAISLYDRLPSTPATAGEEEHNDISSSDLSPPLTLPPRLRHVSPQEGPGPIFITSGPSDSLRGPPRFASSSPDAWTRPGPGGPTPNGHGSSMTTQRGPLYPRLRRYWGAPPLHRKRFFVSSCYP